MDTLRSWFTSRKQSNLDEAFQAVYNNFQITELKRVAKKGIRNSNGLTLLHQAVLDNNLEKVNQLCSAGIDMYAVCQKKTALHMALQLQKYEIALALLKHGCDPEHRDVSSQFYHPWHIVMSIRERQSCLGLTELLIAHQADVNREIRLSHDLVTNLPFSELQGMRVCRDFAPVIQLAIGRNDVQLVESIMEGGGAELWRTCNSCSALTRCLTLDISHRLEIACVLLKGDLEVNDAEELIHAVSDCSWDFTPLQICILCTGVQTGDLQSPGQTDKRAVLHALLESGADPAVSAGECKFQLCPGRYQPPLPVPIHEVNPCLYPLCLAVQQLWFDGVLELIQANCHVNWDPVDHVAASRTEHTSAMSFALTATSSDSEDYIIQNSDKILKIVHLLHEAGCDFFGMTDECVDQLHCFISNHRKHPLSVWFRFILATPPTLKICARAFIRKVLGLNPQKKRESLEKYIPRKMISYIMFTEPSSNYI